MHPLETYNGMQLGREHKSEDASQVGKKVSKQSKVMVKSKTYFKKIHSYSLQEKMVLVRGEKCHHKLIGEGQKSLRQQKLNVIKGGVVKSIGVVVTFKICHQ